MDKHTERAAVSTQAALDRLTNLAGGLLNVPVVCASIVDAEQHLMASSYGLPVPAALLISYSLRLHVTASRKPLVVTDGLREPLLAQSPAVRDGTVRACVGMPLRTRDGRAVGTLLAMDPKPRRWTTPQLDVLARLSTLIVDEMELSGAVRRAS